MNLIFQSFEKLGEAKTKNVSQLYYALSKPTSTEHAYIIDILHMKREYS
jgi:hypothetical protein